MTLGGAAGLALVVLGAMVGCQRPASVEPATFVGAAKCATCHQKEAAAYRGSDHARAMQQADDTTVLGDFHNARFTHRGVTSTFFRRDGKFLVRTDGPDGKLNDFEITHTFGVTPLQQYLVPFPDGRLQTLGIAWDTRSKAQGGSAGFTSIQARHSWRRIRCTGRDGNRRGTTSVPSATQPTFRRTTTRGRIVMQQPGPNCPCRVRPVTDPVRPTSHGRRSIRPAARRPRPALQASW